MSNIIIPRDILLQRAIATPDIDMNAPQDGSQAGEQSSSIGNFTFGVDDHGTVMPLGLPSATPLFQTSSLQFASGLASEKKLGASSMQELYRFAQASEPERQMMNFALGLELRDGVNLLTAATAAAGIHSDLLKNIKEVSAAAFFSPQIAYYTSPSGSKRSKSIQNTIYDILKSSRVPHLPIDGDKASKDKVISAIGRELTYHRSNVKEELSERKANKPESDIASFASRLLHNTTIKVTRAHHGRIAFLSHEWRTWSNRETTPGVSEKAKKLGYWEWVDATLERDRKDFAASVRGKEEASRIYFEDIIKEDKTLFSKATRLARDPREREQWQVNVEAAIGRLVG